ncbi:MAG: DUF4893 domain-containing protein [Caulobacterales bacterium]|nr:DUF4893 domain-containing protein [Caulobacterales bacterium]
MTRARLSALAVVLVGLAACATPPTYGPPYGPMPPPPPAPPSEGSGGSVLLDWRAIITPDDRSRLDRIDEAWRRALDQARRSEGSGDLLSVGALIDPHAMIENAAPPPGMYRCRTVKLGYQGATGLGFVVYGWFDCEISRTAQGLRLVKVTGSQRPSGLLFPEDDLGLVFLGSMALGDEPRARSYGTNDERDFAARFERIGRQRWRLVIPWPENESTLDLIELVPAS